MKLYVTRVLVMETNGEREAFVSGDRIRIEQDAGKVEPYNVVLEGRLIFEDYEDTFYIRDEISMVMVHKDNILNITRL
ncbi:hypothetical protein [Bacillus phage Nachito]|nr:hypothetical protein [Bacillus phage Nachito]